GRSGDQDNPLSPMHGRMQAIDRDLIREGHYGQRSCEPRKQAEHMAAPTNAAYVQESPCQLGAVHTWGESGHADRTAKWRLTCAARGRVRGCDHLSAVKPVRGEAALSGRRET